MPREAETPCRARRGLSKNRCRVDRGGARNASLGRCRSWIAFSIAAFAGARHPARTFRRGPTPRRPLLLRPATTERLLYSSMAAAHRAASAGPSPTITAVRSCRTGDEGCHNATGGVVGGQIGYRWQAANWVFGVEAQGDWASLTGSNPSLALTVIQSPTRPGSTASACSPARSATPGTTCCST